MTRTPPLVTAIVPAYNGEAFLREAIDSILAQAHRPLEIIVVDDGSTDRTAQIAQAAAKPVRYVRQPHRGRPAVGRNVGLRLARGEWIAFLDQDDLWTPDGVALQAAYLADHASIDVVLGRTQRWGRVGRPDGTQGFARLGSPLRYTHVSCALFRRRAFERVGPFDESLRFHGDDTDWFARAREIGLGMHRLDEVTLLWRIHERNTSHDPVLRNHVAGYDRPLTEVVRRALERKRRRGDA